MSRCHRLGQQCWYARWTFHSYHLNITVSNISAEPEMADLYLLDAEVAIALHNGALGIAGLLVGALPGAAAIMVDCELAIVLHAELHGAILAEDAHADHEPVAVVKSAVAHFE